VVQLLAYYARGQGFIPAHYKHLCALGMVVSMYSQKMIHKVCIFIRYLQSITQALQMLTYELEYFVCESCLPPTTIAKTSYIVCMPLDR
jgi:hypothetical protein